jgi:hypothetical protein
VNGTPETDGLTVGCSFGPFVEALAEHARKLERERDALKLENATLKRQVELFVDATANRTCHECPAIKSCERLASKCEQTLRQWSLEQAKKGGGE